MIKSLFEEFVKYYYVYKKNDIKKNDIEKSFKEFINKCMGKKNAENLINNFLPFDLKGEIDTALLYKILPLDYINNLINNEKVKTILCIETENQNEENYKKCIEIKANKSSIIKLEIFNEKYINNKIKKFLDNNCKENNKENN